MNPRDIGPLRACLHCTHSLDEAGVLWCTEPNVCGPDGPVMCLAARDRLGGCGWEARCLDWPGVTRPPVPPPVPPAFAPIPQAQVPPLRLIPLVALPLKAAA